jgi:hypothetical protein
MEYRYLGRTALKVREFSRFYADSRGSLPDTFVRSGFCENDAEILSHEFH